jgi:VanZ family protein
MGDPGADTEPPVRSAIRWLAVAAWMAAIFLFSNQPNLRVSDEPGLDFVVRKVGHFVVFGVLAVLLFEALAGPGPGRTQRRRALVAFGVTVLYAASDEIHQAFVAGRGPAVTDVVIDGAGAAVVLWLWTRVRPRLAAGPAGKVLL